MAPNPVVVQVGMVAPAVMNVPLWAADDAGEFARRGLTIETRFIGSTDRTTNALLAGDVDVAFGSPDPALTDPHQVVILAGIVDRPPLSLVCRPGLTSFADLRGKRFGTTSFREGTVQLIQAMMIEHGLHYPGDYNLVLAGAHPQRWKALQEGAIDAAMQLIPFDFMAADAGYPVLGRAEDVVPDFAFSSVCVRTDWPPDLFQRFRDGMLAGEQIVRRDRTRAAGIIAQQVHIGADYAKRCVDRLVDDGVMPVGLVHSAKALDRTRQAIADSASMAGG